MILRRLLALLLLFGLTVPAIAMPQHPVTPAGQMVMTMASGDDHQAPCHKSAGHGQLPAKCHDCIGCAARVMPALLASPTPLPRPVRSLPGRAEPLLALAVSPEPPPPRF